MQQVKYHKDGHVAYITLNNPDSLNAVSRQMVRELKDVWTDFRDDKNLWVGILSGEGRAFCAGADVKGMERGAWQFRQSLILGEEKVGHANHGLWKPLIAAVHRHTYGAGMMLALESDIVVAADDTLFGIPESKVNVPTLIAPFLLDFMPRIIATEMLYTGKPIDANRAYELGMINKVVPRDQLMASAEEYAQMVCEMGPLANWASKEIMWRTRNLSVQDTITIVEHIATPVWNSEDSIEAKKAFQEKRKPNWQVK